MCSSKSTKGAKVPPTQKTTNLVKNLKIPLQGLGGASYIQYYSLYLNFKQILSFSTHVLGEIFAEPPKLARRSVMSMFTMPGR